MPAIPHTALVYREGRALQGEMCYRALVAGRRIVIAGAGGNAREVAWAAREAGFEVVGFAVSDAGLVTQRDSAILGDFDWLRRHRGQFDALAIGIGSPAARLKVAADLERDFDPAMFPALFPPSALLDRSSATLGHGVVFLPGAIGTVNLRLGAHSLVHYGATIGHESSLGRGSVLNPGANISGGVEIGEGVLIGTGAQVLQYLRVGDGATVGAGAVVTRDILPGETAVGVPARAR
jgi:sugar O-acyltransferase (sialic acid O-acetyltransferase NeuD family)